METKDNILQLADNYLSQFKDEHHTVQPLLDFVNQNEGEQLYNRSNFAGHITASAFIVNQNATHLLLLQHKALKRWLQPGGHVDYTDSNLLTAAKREAAEETGLTNNQLTAASEEIFDIDSHAIPENKKKQEPAHIHHDIRFLFYSSVDTITIAEAESTGSKWIPLSDLKNDELFARIARKIKDRNSG